MSAQSSSRGESNEVTSDHESILRPCGKEEVPQDLKAFFGHPLTAATTAINGDEHASALALLHEYHNLPAIDRSDIKIRDKYQDFPNNPGNVGRRKDERADGAYNTGDAPNVEEYFTNSESSNSNKSTSTNVQFSLADSPQKSPTTSTEPKEQLSDLSTSQHNGVHETTGSNKNLTHTSTHQNEDYKSPVKNDVYPSQHITYYPGDNQIVEGVVPNQVSSTQQGHNVEPTATLASASFSQEPPQLDFVDQSTSSETFTRTTIGTPSKEHETLDEFQNDDFAMLPSYSSTNDDSDSDIPPILDNMVDTTIEENNNSVTDELNRESDDDKKPSDSTKKIIQILNEKIRKKQSNANVNSEDQIHINEISQIMKEVLDKSAAKCRSKAQAKKKKTGKSKQQDTQDKTQASASQSAPNMTQLLNQQTQMPQRFHIPPQGIVPLQNPPPLTAKPDAQGRWFQQGGQVPVRIMGPYNDWSGPYPGQTMQGQRFPMAASPMFGPNVGHHQGYYMDAGGYQVGVMDHRQPMMPMMNDNQNHMVQQMPVQHMMPNQYQDNMQPKLIDNGLNGACNDMPNSVSVYVNTLGVDAVKEPPEDDKPNEKKPTKKAAKRKRSQSTGKNAVILQQAANPQPVYTPSLVIPKRDPDPTGYTCYIESPISKAQRIEEEKITYMNKGQYYGLTLEYKNKGRSLKCNTVKSLIMLLFREDKDPNQDMKAWDFWHSRQHSNKQRIIDIDIKNSTGIISSCAEDVASNAVVVRWNPLEQPAKISFTVNCLSTDFSNQKGVKGLPLHVQVDTFEELKSETPIHRAYCQVKIFCDKGAERKTRDEERRKEKSKFQPELGRKKESDNNIVYHESEERSKFYSMVNLEKKPLLFRPIVDYESFSFQCSVRPVSQVVNSEKADSTSTEFTDTTPAIKRVKLSKPQEPQSAITTTTSTTSTTPAHPCPGTPKEEQQKVLLYVRDEHEKVFTALLLHSPTVVHLSQAIEEKYNIPTHKLRNIYKKGKKGILVRMDDNILTHYPSETTFIIDIDEKDDQWDLDDHYYDVTFTETSE
ncbi:unnamed protein product [Owenia fusiformis]|uniref:Uncharacterized protein n=1 Tax=Owenia fusiformis TaxID=6347 RepID=A0A8J1UD75_OWEFU|nr:unnamed protein product [Owenia fusiformis]